MFGGGLHWSFDFSVLLVLFCFVGLRCVSCVNCSMSLDYPFSTSPSVLSNACVLIKAVGRNNRDNNLCRPLKNNVGQQLHCAYSFSESTNIAFIVHGA